jgi:hypothetical protein
MTPATPSTKATEAAEFAGKVALVTGAARGVGKATVALLGQPWTPSADWTSW